MNDQVIELADNLCQTNIIRPDWQLPENVHAVSTLRGGGFSKAPYHGLNLGSHVGDNPESVELNRQCLMRLLNLPSEPFWLNQVHRTDVAVLRQQPEGTNRCADAAVTTVPGKVCTVLTADCLPLLFCDRGGERVAAAHAGWRGLAAGVIERTVMALRVPAQNLQVWLGPAIGPASFEVGHEVRECFVQQDLQSASAFLPGAGGRYYADIYQLARLRLLKLGIESIFGGEKCTFSQSDQFFSYRRDGATGRMATLIWFD